MTNISKSTKREFLLMAVLFMMGVTISGNAYYYGGVDWIETFHKVADRIGDPYSIPTFINPPWAVLLVSWASGMTVTGSFAIHAGFSFLFVGWMVRQRSNDLIALFLTLTSAPFLYNLFLGNIEWVVAIGFIVGFGGNGWGLPFLLIKPQSGIFAAIQWFKESSEKFRFLMPSAYVILVSFALWGWWFIPLLENVEFVESIGMDGWNAAPFPWGIPIGLLLLYYVTAFNLDSREGEFYGSLISLLIFPYFGIQSLVIPFALFVSRSPRLAMFGIWLFMWCAVLVAAKIS